MDIENVSDGRPEGQNFIQRAMENPTIRLAGAVVLEVTLITIGAFIGYKAGKTKGVKQGEIKGYASALNDIGVKPAEVPTLATAWAEGKQLAQESMTKAMDNVPA